MLKKKKKQEQKLVSHLCPSLYSIEEYCLELFPNALFITFKRFVVKLSLSPFRAVASITAER